MANGDASKLVSDKAYRLIIEGVVPIDIAGLPPEEIAAVILSGVTVGLGMSRTISSFNCKLLQQIPQQNTRQ